MNMIPFPYRILLVLAICTSLFAVGWYQGASNVKEQWEMANAKQSLLVADLKKRQAEATVQVVTKYVDRVQVIRTRGATIVKEIPIYVTKEADAACVVPRGFVSLHDDAAANRLPDPSGGADASPAGIALSAAGRTVADNYRRCHENAEQVMGLQNFIRSMNKAAEW